VDNNNNNNNHNTSDSFQIPPADTHLLQSVKLERRDPNQNLRQEVIHGIHTGNTLNMLDLLNIKLTNLSIPLKGDERNKWKLIIANLKA